MWEKEEMLVTRIFFFSNNVFCIIHDKFCHLDYLCHLQMLSIWTGLKDFCLIKC